MSSDASAADTSGKQGAAITVSLIVLFVVAIVLVILVVRKRRDKHRGPAYDLKLQAAEAGVSVEVHNPGFNGAHQLSQRSGSYADALNETTFDGSMTIGNSTQDDLASSPASRRPLETPPASDDSLEVRRDSSHTNRNGKLRRSVVRLASPGFRESISSTVDGEEIVGEYENFDDDDGADSDASATNDDATVDSVPTADLLARTDPYHVTHVHATKIAEPLLPRPNHDNLATDAPVPPKGIRRNNKNHGKSMKDMGLPPPAFERPPSFGDAGDAGDDNDGIENGVSAEPPTWGTEVPEARPVGVALVGMDEEDSKEYMASEGVAACAPLPPPPVPPKGIRRNDKNRGKSMKDMGLPPPAFERPPSFGEVGNDEYMATEVPVARPVGVAIVGMDEEDSKEYMASEGVAACAPLPPPPVPPKGIRRNDKNRGKSMKDMGLPPPAFERPPSFGRPDTILIGEVGSDEYEAPVPPTRRPARAARAARPDTILFDIGGGGGEDNDGES